MKYSNESTEDLIIRHMSGELRPQEERALAALLEESTAARELMASYMRIEGATMQLAQAGLTDLLAQERQHDVLSSSFNEDWSADVTAANRSAHIWQAAFWIAAVCLLVGVTCYVWVENSADLADDGSMRPLPAPTTVARLNRVVNVEWQMAELPTEIGAGLPPCRLGLAAGLVEIEFDDGAVVILEGPAELEIVAMDRAFLHHGKLRGVVPPGAEGFTVESADMTIIDLGTEFGMKVEASGAAEVHVFDGEVELQKIAEFDEGAERNVLQAGSAVRIAADGVEQSIDADDSSFVSPTMMTVVAEVYVDELQRELEAFAQRERWLIDEVNRLTAEIRRAPDALAQLQFVKDAEQALAEFERNHIDEVKVFQDVEAAKRSLEKLLIRKVGSNEEVKLLRRQIKRLRAEAAGLKRKAQGRKPDKQEIEALRERRTAATTGLKAAESQLSLLFKNARRDDPQLRQAQTQLQDARRAADIYRAAAQQYRGLRKRIADAKKEQQLIVRKLQRDSQPLRAVRAELKVVTSRIRAAKKDERDLQSNAAT